MKINKRRTPELIAGVLLLSIFFVPCAGVHAEDFSEEQKDSIKSVVAEAIGESDVVTKTDLDSSVKKAVRDANNSAGSQNSLTKENVGAIVNDVLEKAGIKTSATKKDVSSVKTPAWLAFGVPTGLGLACLALLIVLMVRKPKKTDDESEKAKRNKERDEYFNGLFKSLDDKIQKVQTTISANKPPTALEIGDIVKTSVYISVKPKLEVLDKKIENIKVPNSEEIAMEVFGAVNKELESMKKVVGDTTNYLEETRQVIGGVNQDYHGAISLLEKIETDRKLFEQEKQKVQNELEEKGRALDKKLVEFEQIRRDLNAKAEALAAREKDLSEGKNAEEDVELKSGNLDLEKKNLVSEFGETQEQEASANDGKEPLLELAKMCYRYREYSDCVRYLEKAKSKGVAGAKQLYGCFLDESAKFQEAAEIYHYSEKRNQPSESLSSANASPSAAETTLRDSTALNKDRIILFATSNCPNCKMARRFLDQAAIDYEIIFANEDIASSDLYGIRQAPTLVVIRGGKKEKYENISNIRRFIEEDVFNPFRK